MAQVAQFKITLNGVKPVIWRRFIVDGELSFYDLHLVIQVLMGWFDLHLHQFVYEKHSIIGDPDLLEDDEVADAKEVKINDIFNAEGVKMKYIYDFGDSWEHELVLEKIYNDESYATPMCIKGARNGALEDCGGAPFFMEILKALGKDKNAAGENGFYEIPPGYDPAEFDIDAINKQLQDYKNNGSSGLL